MQTNEIENETIEHEFARYFLKCRIYDPQNQELMEFWKTNETQLPRLFALAKIILAISPTSSRCERNFSVSNSLMSKKRASMNPERAHRVLFLHDNINILMTFIERVINSLFSPIFDL